MTISTIKRIIYFSLHLAFLALVGSASSTSTGNVVDLGYASYRGNLSFPNTVAYLGIPYAEPPLGDHRFRSPIALNTTRVVVESGGKVVDATAYPDFCVQGSTGGGDAGGAGSENCLKVNVYAPAGAKKGDNLPVLVYIHGGGYVFGNPANWPFDHWIHQVPDVVIASVYYRLDSLGFLSHPEFSSDPSLGDLNVGFQDQTEALRWIQKHIDAFGGDPSRVTINGESAGGSSVELHLTAVGNDGLFHGGITQSVYRATVPTPQQQVPLFNHFVEEAGCGGGDLGTQMSCLRKASVSAIAHAQDSGFDGSYHIFLPVQDPKTIPTTPSIAILNGNFKGVPLIVGSTSNETLSSGTDISVALKASWPQLTETDLQEFVTQYPLSEFTSASQQFQVATGESALICARAIMGNAFAKKTKAFTYRYNQPNPTSGSSAVGHAAENFMMFRGSNTGFNGTGTFTPLTPTETTFAEELIAYWLSFVRSGDPNTFKLSTSPSWPTYELNTKLRVVLQQGTVSRSSSFIEVEDPQEGERCAFVATKAEHEQN